MKNNGFDDDGMECSCFASKKITDHSNEMVQKVGNPIALIEDLNEGSASNVSSDHFRGIASR